MMFVGICATTPGCTLPFRISMDFAVLKNILSATVFSLICIPRKMVAQRP
jgi:hypothetical protein